MLAGRKKSVVIKTGRNFSHLLLTFCTVKVTFYRLFLWILSKPVSLRNIHEQGIFQNTYNNFKLLWGIMVLGLLDIDILMNTRHVMADYTKSIVYSSIVGILVFCLLDFRQFWPLIQELKIFLFMSENQRKLVTLVNQTSQPENEERWIPSYPIFRDFLGGLSANLW